MRNCFPSNHVFQNDSLPAKARAAKCLGFPDVQALQKGLAAAGCDDHFNPSSSMAVCKVRLLKSLKRMLWLRSFVALLQEKNEGDVSDLFRTALAFFPAMACAIRPMARTASFEACELWMKTNRSPLHMNGMCHIKHESIPATPRHDLQALISLQHILW